MADNVLRIGGALCVWRAAEWTRRAALKAGLEALGLGQFVPERRTPGAALKDALEAVFSGKGDRTVYEVRRLKGYESFEVLRVTRNEYPTPNSRDVVTVAKIGANNHIEFTPDPPEWERVIESFNEHLGLLRAAQVTDALVGVLVHLGATSPARGVYWLPDDRRAQFRVAARAFESAGHRTSYQIYLLSNVMDAEAVRCVRDAITSEIGAEAGHIYAELTNPDEEEALGERALLNRKARIDVLRGKVREYEALLQVGLEQLTAQLDNLEQTGALASLLVSAGGGEAA